MFLGTISFAILYLGMTTRFCAQILMLDQLLAEKGTTHYAVALAQKPAEQLKTSLWRRMLGWVTRLKTYG
jgi:hypothetical protein